MLKLTLDEVNWTGTGNFFIVIKPLSKGESRFPMLGEIVLLGTTSGWQTVATGAGTPQFGLNHNVLFLVLSHGD